MRAAKTLTEWADTRLSWVFAGRTATLLVLSWGGSSNHVNYCRTLLTCTHGGRLSHRRPPVNVPIRRTAEFSLCHPCKWHKGKHVRTPKLFLDYRGDRTHDLTIGQCANHYRAPSNIVFIKVALDLLTQFNFMKNREHFRILDFVKFFFVFRTLLNAFPWFSRLSEIVLSSL